MVLGFGLGALGGADFYNPTRKGLPNAGQVQSDQEWNNDWDSKISAVPEYLREQVTPGMDVQLVRNAPGFDRGMAKPYLKEINEGWRDRFLTGVNFGDNPQMEVWGQIFDEATDQGYVLVPDGRGGFTKERSAYGNRASGEGSHTVYQAPTFENVLNPERDRLRGQQEQAWQGRQENQMRQQQAYDWMQGAGQENAVMSPDYANAGFNQITGLSNPYAGPGQTEGVGMDWAAGVYDPTTQQGTGTYNPTHKRTNFGW